MASLVLAGAFALTGCSKKMQPFTSDNFIVVPQPLEEVGGKVPATVTGNVPAKFFVKDAEVTVTPYLVYGDKETASVPYTFQAEKVRGNNPTIAYETGGTATVPVRFDYNDDMLSSALWLAFSVTQGSKTYTLPRIKVADGVIATSNLASAKTVVPATAADKFQRVISEKVSADIKFLINQTNIRKSELESKEIADLKQTLKDAQGNAKLDVKELNISSYASPEGGVKLNTRIAEGREKNTTAYLNKTLKENKITDYGTLTSDFTPQDWEGFQQYVAESNIQDKELILSVLSMYKDPEQREREIRNLSSIFDQLKADVLPKLRYSRMTAMIDVIGKSDAELKAAYASDPSTLTVDELLYTATLESSVKDQAKVYKTCTEVYPDDFRGWNNLGKTQYAEGDYKEAARNFKKALTLNSQSGEASMNLALIDMVNGNNADAKQKLGNAAGVEGLGDALGVYYLNQGDYNAAVKSFGDSNSNNAILAKILTRDYAGAKKSLVSVSNPDATTYYLLAVLGARTDNNKMVTSNLRQAVKLNPSLADRARKDLEFAKVNLSDVL